MELPPLQSIGNRTYSTPYWGSQALRIFPSEIVRLMENGRRYVDLTAGGGGMVFRLSHSGQRVHGNDRNPYSAFGFQSFGKLQHMLQGRKPRDVTEEVAAWIHPGEIPLLQGGLATFDQRSEETSLSRRIAPFLDIETAAYIDALCGLGTLPAYLAGRVLMGSFTFRGYGWARRLVDKRETSAVKPLEFWQSCVRRLHLMTTAAAAATGRVSGSRLEALEAAQEVVQPGDFVYSDPAWPWGPEEQKAPSTSSPNPYTFLTQSLGSLLLQQRVVVNGGFWSAEDPQRIYADVESWMRAAFQRGARYFCLSTQGTNYPVPAEVFATLARIPDFTEVLVLKRESTVSAAHKKFTEWFGVYEANGTLSSVQTTDA
jgi:hypothetical protein